MTLVDFHTHVLPGIDDGSQSVERSIAMLQKLADQGVQQVIATPHFYAEHQSPEEFFARRQEAEITLRTALKEQPGLPELLVGAEVAFFEGISDCEFLEELAISGTRCVMIEMPMKHWSDRNLQELAGIRQKQKLTPIIAHMDRYIRPLYGKWIPERLAELPVYVQVNASFFERRMTRRKALHLLKERKIHLIGSDCHNLETRKPNMDAAMRVIARRLPEMIGEINGMEREILAAQVAKGQLI